MGNNIAKAAHGLFGIDMGGDNETPEGSATTSGTSVDIEAQVPIVTKPVNKASVLSVPKNPLKSIQIERAWQEFASVCTEVESVQDFNIEYDLELEKPIRIALLDTGVFQEHEALLGRVTRVRNFVPRSCQEDANEDLIHDRNGHGTFCAGLAVGGAFVARPDGGGPQEHLFKNGVAPFAKLVVGKVMDNEGRTNVDWLLKGLKWACDIDRVDNRRMVNADIICIPSGFSRYHPELRYILYLALQMGKVVVCCAGGEGEEATYDIQYPARFGDVICTGSQSENGQPTSFTPAGREIDFLAPGDNIWSASQPDPSGVRCDSATSYSVAIVAGICALVIAYAEKLGGKDLRKLVSHAGVMKEILRRMSSTPGHHDRLAGHGNIIPYRLFKYGPQTFFNEVCSIVHQVDTDIDLQHTTTNLGPLQPVLSNFNAGSIMAALPVDKGALESLLRPLIKERVIYKWYQLLINTFTNPTYNAQTRPIMLRNPLPKVSNEVDLSLPLRDFLKVAPVTNPKGINLTNIIDIYFEGSEEYFVDKLILPEYQHVLHLDVNRIFDSIRPTSVVLPGEVPLKYMFDILRGLHIDPDKDVTIVCEKLSPCGPSNVGTHTLQDNLAEIKTKLNIFKVKVFVPDIIVVDENINEELASALVSICSAKMVSSLMHCGWTKDKSYVDTISDILFTQGEKIRFGSQEDLPESSQVGHSDKQESVYNFAIWPEIKTILSDKRPEIAMAEFAHKAKPIADALLKGYVGALHILGSGSLSDKVTSIDLRLPHIALSVPRDLDIKALMPKTDLRIVPTESTMRGFTMLEEDLRSISLSGTLRSLNVKMSPTCEIQELIIPCLDRICDLEETFNCPLWRKCRNLFIPSEAKFSDLLHIIRLLPKGDYTLTIHVERLKLENSLAGEKARDFDVPDGLRVYAYGVFIDPLFFQMSKETIKSLYEICLKLSSTSCLKFLKEQCELFLKHKDTYTIPYNCCNCFNACKLLEGFLTDALGEELVSGENAILYFCQDVFKFSIMTSAVGRERYRRAFKPPDSDITYKLPANTYRNQLTNTKGIFSALKTGKIRNVTVAILGSGINAFHPEFNLKLNQARDAGRDRNCPFGESILGLAFNAVPSETMQTFLDQDSCIGTICASLVAGKSKGAAPFANIVSLKVTNSSYHSKPEYVNAALAWLLDQEDKSYLPPSDVILIPLNFLQMSFELRRILNHICKAGKIVICSTARFDGQLVPGSDSMHIIGYPASSGDVICIGGHGINGESLPSSGQGRAVDMMALGILEPDEDGQKTKMSPLPKIPIIMASAQVTGVVAYILAYAEFIGGPSLRQAISNNTVMREILRQMCTKPGQHDEKSGYGCFSPHQVFKYGDSYFKKIVSDITEEYYEIATDHPKPRPNVRRYYSVQPAAAVGRIHAEASRSRSSSFTSRETEGRGRRRGRLRTHSESIN